jgi:hypothetical protein
MHIDKKSKGNPVRISPKYSVDDWKYLSFVNETDWREAVEIFRDRFESRFLDFIKRVVLYEYSGFAILAIDCLLIETLQQFFLGIDETPPRRSKSFFIQFLTNTSFSNYFDDEKASRFYDCIRCGILHQGEIKSNSRILIDKSTPLVALPPEGDGIIINRRLFHNELLKVYKQYVDDLLTGNGNNELRINFRRKMNYVCRIPLIE